MGDLSKLLIHRMKLTQHPTLLFASWKLPSWIIFDNHPCLHDLYVSICWEHIYFETSLNNTAAALQKGELPEHALHCSAAAKFCIQHWNLSSAEPLINLLLQGFGGYSPRKEHLRHGKCVSLIQQRNSEALWSDILDLWKALFYLSPTNTTLDWKPLYNC